MPWDLNPVPAMRATERDGRRPRDDGEISFPIRRGHSHERNSHFLFEMDRKDKTEYRTRFRMGLPNPKSVLPDPAIRADCTYTSPC